MKKKCNIKHIEFDKMPNFEKSRWMALYEAVNVIAEKADDRKVNFNELSIKQPAMVKYINSSCDSICQYLETEGEENVKRSDDN